MLLDCDDRGAAFAVELYVQSIGRELGTLAAALGNVDAIVFTGGIGDNLTPICERFMSNASLRGVKPDGAGNEGGGQRDGQPGYRVVASDQRAGHDRQPCLEGVAGRLTIVGERRARRPEWESSIGCSGVGRRSLRTSA
jgi:hypothetical protein